MTEKLYVYTIDQDSGAWGEGFVFLTEKGHAKKSEYYGMSNLYKYLGEFLFPMDFVSVLHFDKDGVADHSYVE